jgi:hypothetical protein
MKKSILLPILILFFIQAMSQNRSRFGILKSTEDKCLACTNPSALTITKPSSDDEDDNYEEYGGSLNVGLGLGYYSYIAGAFPMVHVNYEFDVARNITLAPFMTVYSYRNYVVWGTSDFPSRSYYFKRTVIPVGIKGSYYFDELLNAGNKWDFYGGASLGFTLAKVTWEPDYYGLRTITRGIDPLYINLHAGTKYHLNNNSAVFFELSPAMSSLGVTLYLE